MDSPIMLPAQHSGNDERGFTLIELSIVLVIIGLIVGGVLVGQSLVSAAEVRAQITQIEKYNAAVNTFHSKFNAIPGDMNVATAQQFGFVVGTACSGTSGRRDGNGLIDGGPTSSVLGQAGYEAGLFWEDISSNVAGNLIDGSFPNSGATIPCLIPGITIAATAINNYIPAGKIGHGTSVYVYEYSGANWFGLGAMTSITSGGGAVINAYSIPVIEAYNIDKKVDDGLPLSGNIQTTYVSADGIDVYNAGNAVTSGGTSSSCSDSTTSTYSVTQNNGNGGNCSLSFKFQ